MALFKILKRMIERENYTSKEDMMNKLNILMLNQQITEDEYQELVDLLGQ